MPRKSSTKLPPLTDDHSLRFMEPVRTKKGPAWRFVCGCGEVGEIVKSVDKAGHDYSEHIR